MSTPLGSPQENQNTEDQALWYAVRARSRHEKLIARQLEARRLECFLPVYERRSRWQDRVKMVTWPLFPGYLFTRIRLDQRNLVVTLSGVVGLVGSGRRPQSVPEDQIERIRRMCQAPTAMPCAYLVAGDPCEIIQGPLAGLRGILIRRKGAYRLVLSVDLIRRSASVEVSIEEVVPLPRSALRTGRAPSA